MVDSKVRCGVIGTGYLGQHHARIYAALEETEFVGIVEADDARAEEMCREYKCKRFSSAEELAAECDAVSVVVPTDKHCEVALPLLNGGCHLLIHRALQPGHGLFGKCRDSAAISDCGPTRSL